MENLKQIVAAGLEHGYETNANRRTAYNTILKITKTEEEYENYYLGLKSVLDERSLHVIDADVKRSLQSIYKDREKLLSHRETFQEVLTNVFRAESNLKYYQGFHDVASGIYLVYCDKDDKRERLVYTCSEAARRVLRAYLLEYAHPDDTRLLTESNKFFKLSDVLVPNESPKLKVTQFTIMSFFPILITMAIHRVFEEETVLRCLDFCLAGGRYAPSYICCAIVDTTKLEEGEDIELGNKQDSDRVLLSGLKYGYRNEDEDEYEFISKIISRAAEMIQEVLPNKVFKDALPIEKIIPQDIDIPWELSMDVKPEEDLKPKLPVKRRELRRVIFFGLLVVGVGLIAVTGYFGIRRLKTLELHKIGKHE